MGADLYIMSLNNQAREKYESKWDKAVKERDSLFKLNPELGSLAISYTVGYTEVSPRQLTLISKDKELFDKMVKIQNKVVLYYNKMNSEGYFRDSYNVSSIMSRLGLSWWKDVVPLKNKKGEISVRNCKKLLAMVEDANLHLPTKEELIASNARIDDDEYSVAEWHKLFKKRKQMLVKFIKLAIELDEPIVASL